MMQFRCGWVRCIEIYNLQKSAHVKGALYWSIKAWPLFTRMSCIPIKQEPLSVTYFDEVPPCTSPFGQLSLSIFVPDKMSHGYHPDSRQVNPKPWDKKIPGPLCGPGIFLYKSLAVTYFHMGPPTLSSALSCFTSEFGMGSGGANSLWPPGINGLS